MSRTYNDHHQLLVRRLDKLVSVICRLSNVWVANENIAWVKCATCGTSLPWTKIQCGHYIPRHRESTRFNMDNVRPQCPRCNNYHEGEHWLMRKKLVEELGEERVQHMEFVAEKWGLQHQPDAWLEYEIEARKPIAKALIAKYKKQEV